MRVIAAAIHGISMGFLCALVVQAPEEWRLFAVIGVVVFSTQTYRLLPQA